MPRSLKASYRLAYERVCKEHNGILDDAILRALKGKPKEAFPFVQLGAHYIDGKPAEQHEHRVTEPVRVVHEFAGVK